MPSALTTGAFGEIVDAADDPGRAGLLSGKGREPEQPDAEGSQTSGAEARPSWRGLWG
jgi:hypothetical protein